MLKGKNKRALTELLRKASEKEITSPKGYPTTHGKMVAEKMWDMAVNGRVVFGEGDDARILEPSARDWKDTVAWLFNQIDGPARLDNDSQDPLLKQLESFSYEDLMKMADRWRDSRNSEEDDIVDDEEGDEQDDS